MTEWDYDGLARWPRPPVPSSAAISTDVLPRDDPQAVSPGGRDLGNEALPRDTGQDPREVPVASRHISGVRATA